MSLCLWVSHGTPAITDVNSERSGEFDVLVNGIVRFVYQFYTHVLSLQHGCTPI